MSQSRGVSLAETIFNTTLGFGINWSANMAILPLFGFNVTGTQAFNIGVLFTLISVVRSYGVRRLFNYTPFAHAMERANAVLNRYIGVPYLWLKTRLASVTSRAPSVAPRTTSPATTTDTPTASPQAAPTANEPVERERALVPTLRGLLRVSISPPSSTETSPRSPPED